MPAPSPGRTVRDAIASELAGGDWCEVLGRHVGFLVDRLDAHLFHGLIRTAHAARALRDHDGPEARAELASGLAAWTVWAAETGAEVAPSPATDPLGEILELARRGAAAFVAQRSSRCMRWLRPWPTSRASADR